MLNLFAVTIVDCGIAGILIGVASIVKPLRFLGIRSRMMGVAVIAASIVLIVAGMLTPAPLQHVTQTRTALDRAMPAWQFSESHATTVNAPPDRVYRAIKETTADDILFFRALIWIRRFGRSGPESIMNAPEKIPLLDVATRTTFAMLTDTPQEIVVGTVVVAPRASRRARGPTADELIAVQHRDGFAAATMNFAVAPREAGVCDVTTETRVFSADPRTARLFGAYWRVIYPGSSLIRYMWLRAIKKRAEAPAATLRRGRGEASATARADPAGSPTRQPRWGARGAPAPVKKSRQVPPCFCD